MTRFTAALSSSHAYLRCGGGRSNLLLPHYFEFKSRTGNAATAVAATCMSPPNTFRNWCQGVYVNIGIRTQTTRTCTKSAACTASYSEVCSHAPSQSYQTRMRIAENTPIQAWPSINLSTHAPQLKLHTIARGSLLKLTLLQWTICSVCLFYTWKSTPIDYQTYATLPIKEHMRIDKHSQNLARSPSPSTCKCNSFVAPRQ